MVCHSLLGGRLRPVFMPTLCFPPAILPPLWPTSLSPRWATLCPSTPFVEMQPCIRMCRPFGGVYTRCEVLFVPFLVTYSLVTFPTSYKKIFTLRACPATACVVWPYPPAFITLLYPLLRICGSDLFPQSPGPLGETRRRWPTPPFWESSTVHLDTPLFLQTSTCTPGGAPSKLSDRFLVVLSACGGPTRTHAGFP